MRKEAVWHYNGGDFRKILSVITKSSRAHIVSTTLNQSKLWDKCRVFMLKTNMRLNMGNSEAEIQKIAFFSKWVLDVGNGMLHNIHPENLVADLEIRIPEEFLIRGYTNPVHSIVRTTYPEFIKNLNNEFYLRQGDILTPTNVIVDDINHYMLDLIPGEVHTYPSHDSVFGYRFNDDDYSSDVPIEYLNSSNMLCLPKHELKLKVGSVVMLMRNLNQIMGLCNGTRMIVMKCMNNNIQYKILCGSQVGSKHIIPRMEMEPTDTKWPFPFKKVQFHLQMCFAITVNKSQGQPLDTVVLYLRKSVFSHGQLYVPVYRVTSPNRLHILVQNDSENSSSFTANANVVMKNFFTIF